MSKTIVVPIDGSESALQALDVAAELAPSEDDKIILLTVIGNKDVPKELQRYLEVEHVKGPPEWEYDQLIGTGIMDEGKKRLHDQDIHHMTTLVERGDPAKMIATTANQHSADMIVMGNRGLGNVTGLVFGSVSRKVNHLAGCTVVTVNQRVA
jgi:nucleotide-binding universal stress UspA family protein